MRQKYINTLVNFIIQVISPCVKRNKLNYRDIPSEFIALLIIAVISEEIHWGMAKKLFLQVYG